MIAQAIDEAVDRTKAAIENVAVEKVVDIAKPVLKTNRSSQNPGEVIHEGNIDAQIVDAELRRLIKEKCGSSENFFNGATKGNDISRKEWKAALRHLGMTLSDGECCIRLFPYF